MDLKKLQNGSDIRGVALPGKAGEDVNMTKDAIERIARGFVLFLTEKLNKKVSDLTISIGNDSRLSADAIRNQIVQIYTGLNIKTLDSGLASTPSMFMSTIFSEYEADGAIMITASHLPFNRNGFKFFTKDGGLEKADISKIISFAETDVVFEKLANEASETEKNNNCVIVNILDTYSKFLQEKIKVGVNAKDYDHPLKGLKIVVDAGNGAGGFYANDILKPLGADIKGSQFLNPDGNFPNHEPNPENKAAMESISKAVLKEKADLGLIFDTDVDRASAVDKNGKEISRNAIVALAAALISDEKKGTTIVTDSITSDELTVFLEDVLKVKHLRFKRGYRNVINKSIELNQAGIDSELAIETSGHAAYKENYFLDDGAYLATKIVIKAAKLKEEGKTIDSLISGLKEPKEAREIRIPIIGEDFKETGDKVLADLELWAKENAKNGVSIVSPNYEGIRLNFRTSDLSGWMLLRKSLHDPIMPLNIEVTKGEVDDILKMLTPFFKAYSKLQLKF